MAAPIAELTGSDHSDKSTEPLSDVKQFSSFVADIDLTVQVGYRQQPARWIRVETVGSGTLAIVTVDSQGIPATRTLTGIVAGWSASLRIVAIKSTTNVALVTVGW